MIREKFVKCISQKINNPIKSWCPHGDSNPGLRREKAYRAFAIKCDNRLLSTKNLKTGSPVASLRPLNNPCSSLNSPQFLSMAREKFVKSVASTRTAHLPLYPDRTSPATGGGAA